MIKNKICFLLVSSLAIAGCENSAGSDGYRFEQEQFVNQDLRVRVEFATATDIRNKGPQFEGLKAWGIVDPKGSCTIYVPDPRKKYEPEWLGHELTHCIFGEWHKVQNEQRTQK